jgi:DNA-binding beta-propeller fold protein YncE
MGSSVEFRAVRSRTALAVAVFAILLTAAATSTAQAAAPSLLRQFCAGGSGAAQCSIPRGVAVDAASGHIYVADQDNLRIDEFDAWGQFQKAWGWGVRNGAVEAQTCGPKAVPPSSTCQAGLPGVGAGQFGNQFGPAGVAVDSAHDVYVYDWGNNRVQKFDSEGNFLLTLGGEVNKTTNANVCTAVSGNQCGIGVEGAAAAFFSDAPGPGSYVAVGPGDVIFVGDKERVQEFEANGSYIKSIPLPGETVQSLAVDPLGNLYLAFEPEPPKNPLFTSEPNVQKLDATGAPICTLAVKNPRAIAVDRTDHVWVVNGQGEVGILEFSASSCSRIDLGVAEPGFGSAGLTEPTGIASSEACGINGTDVVVPNSDAFRSFIRLYGPAPDPQICPPPLIPPSIDGQFAVSTDTGAATLKARINPHFWNDTRYYVEYGTGKCSQGGCAQQQPVEPGVLLSAAVVDADIPTVGVFLGGLSPDTTYHFRFVAESTGGGPVFGVDPDGDGTEEPSFEEGEEATFHTFAPNPPAKTRCPNQAFRTELSAPLPDCRAYEMVSPVDKNNGDISADVSSFALSSALGDRATFSSYRAFADPQSAPYSSQYLAERGSAGWTTVSISAPRESLSLYPTGGATSTIFFKTFNEELCSGWMVQDSRIALAPEAPADVPNLYRRVNCGGCPFEAFPSAKGGCYELLTSVPPPGFKLEPLVSNYYPAPQGSSSDDTRSVFRADAALTPDACAAPAKGRGLYQVYETLGAGGLQLVSVLPNGHAACTHSSAGTAQSDKEGTFSEDNLHNAVSVDGRRVFWTTTKDSTSAPSGGRGDQPGTLYLRINIGQEQSALSGEECTELEDDKACTLKVSQLVSPEPARFWTADKEGKVAVFSIGETLYRYEDGPTPQVIEIAQGFKGMMGASEDATRIYFSSSEDLAGSGANSEGDEAEAGKPNLYLYGVGGGSRFIGTLESAALSSFLPTPIATRPNLRTARVSADGLDAVFMSTARLTGFDNTDVQSAQADAEVYLYDADAGGLLCISCNPSGVAPTGRKIAPTGSQVEAGQLWAAAQIPGWTEQLRPTRLLFDGGRRIFFQSFEALVTHDTNGMGDVYEWQRADSRQACEEEVGGELFVAETNGCIGLISSGQSPQDSEFLDASNGGKDVLFTTNASLLPQDPGLIDIYDAREGGGFPPAPSIPPPCEGGACQNPAAPPNDPTPSSTSFHGSGNVKHHKKQAKHKKHHKKQAKHKKAQGKKSKSSQNRRRAR